MIDDGMTEDERDDIWERLNHLSHVLVERDEEINRLRTALKWFADAYGKAGFIAAAYVHEPECRCLRCAHDNARTALTQKDANDE